MSLVSWKRLAKSEISRLAGVDLGEFPQGHGCSQKKKGLKKTPIALFRVNSRYTRLFSRACSLAMF